MPILFNHELKYILIVPPKNGCSSIRQWFIDFNNLNCVIEDLKDDKPDTSLHNYDTYIKYFIYRSIHDRFISYCENVIHNGILNNYQNNIEWTNLTNMFTKITGEKLNINTTLTSVFTYLQQINVDKQCDSILDMHHLSQYYWLDTYCNTYNIKKTQITFVNIINIDTIIFSFLEKKHNKKINMRYKNITIRDNNIVDELELNNINIHNLFSQKRYLINNKIYINILSNLYKNDIFDISNCIPVNYISISDKILNLTEPPSDFNYITYLNFNLDLKTNGIISKDELTKHYIIYGVVEKRKYKYEHIPVDFNWKAYTFKNDDLNHFDELSALKHYEYEGYKENRIYN